MDDLTPLERAVIRSLRAARDLYVAGDEDGAREIIHGEAIPMMAAFIQASGTFDVYETSTGPRGTDVADA